MSRVQTPSVTRLWMLERFGNTRQLMQVMQYQLFSLGTYQFFWFLRNYRHFQKHKRRTLTPVRELLLLAGAALGVPLILNLLFVPFSPLGHIGAIVRNLVVPFSSAVGMGWFYYRQFDLVIGAVDRLGYRKKYIPYQLAGLMSAVPLFLFYWTQSSLSRGGTVYDWLIAYLGWFFGAALGAWGLVRAQRVLNFIWKSHQKRTYDMLVSTPVSIGEKLFLAAILIFSLLAWCFFVFLFTEAAGLTHVLEP